jgi:hypothetical protein
LHAAMGPILLNNVTIAKNTAPASGGLQNAAAVGMSNTLLAENSGGNCLGLPTSLGNNLDDGASCALSAPGDLSGLPANLGPLADNGGGTFTHALLPGSAALEAGNDATCLSADQRGVIRPQGLHCDIGAFEAESPATATPPSITGTSTPTPTPTRTATTTRTATPLLSKILFDPVNFSSDVIYSKYARTCVPRGVTIEVMVSPVELVRSVGLFYRLEEKNGTNVTPWSEGYAMIRDNSGVYALVLNSEDFPNDILKWQSEAWLAVQFVANGSDGQPIGRSAVYRQVTLGMCRQ